MDDLSSFFNEKMRLMIIVSEHLTEMEGERFCPLNQQEIASLVPCGKVKANQLIQELIKEGYLGTLRAKGRYYITKRGREILSIIKN